MKIIIIVLKWILGIVFMIFGIALYQVPIPATIIIIIGLFLMPPTVNFIEKNTKYKFSNKTMWFVIIIGFIITISAILYDVSRMNDEKGKLAIAKASTMIDEEKLDSALILINDAKILFSSNNNEALDLENEITKSEDFEYVKKMLSEMTEDEFVHLNKGDLEKTYFSQKTLNFNFVKLLNKHAHERQNIIEELKAIKKQEQIDAEAKAKKENERIDTQIKAKKEQERIDAEIAAKKKLHKNWYSGGTLHSSSISSWKNATEENKLATCADFVATIKKQKGESYNSLKQMKRDAIEMQECIDEAVKGDELINSKISEIAALCSIMLGY